jgi:hypothetical protein
MGETFQEACPQGGDMNAAENGPDPGARGLDSRSHLPGIEEPRRRGGKPHEFWIMSQDETDVFRPPGNSLRAQAIMDENLVALPLKISRNGEEPQGGHPVGCGRDVLLAGDPVGSGWVNENDAQGKSRLLTRLRGVRSAISLRYACRRLSASRVTMFPLWLYRINNTVTAVPAKGTI